MIRSIITGVGHYVPERVVTNFDLAEVMDTNDEWIQERTGIQERRHVEKDSRVSSTDLGVIAAKNALEDAGITAQDIDFILFATLSPDYYFPGNGVLVQKELGCRTIGAMDIRNQCSGFVYAMTTADAFIKSGIYKNILVIGAEVHSFGLDMSDDGRGVSVIFGDGAGAVIVSATEEKGRGILSTNLHSEGEYAEELAVLFPGTKTGWSDELLKEGNSLTKKEIYPYMNGNYVFKHAVTRFPESIIEALTAANKKPEDLDLFIPHQANLRISQFVQKQLGLPDNKVYNNIMRYGNTTAASIPIALSEAKKEGKINKGDLVLMTAFGAGFTWGSVLMNW
ncbi:3-oxoacyl-[acyl-carrier-protein] synthase-3 [Chishuiella changwenlii]|uniref:Beta-ketoacyl-[acyl-carrier-protein] synthase III n=1 Tax=Chishuiella changwenlii TaxID=1434701 RepID=A0A1M6VFF1_9FLAO|nr:beta-ketoacyl-ACP synthase III [Chishuiella changwenlii]GGF10304.1 3-oxoacyl-[acyl-carrier-protein] synthase 3 [Chishuiella changwenlii]SHK80006.1 3-oxoacyl-[acyl-carrier-protein] synthase-3 [Chishuiella changwenlii]